MGIPCLGSQIFFIYDHTVLKKEEDDLQDALVYFFPASFDLDFQCLLCGQLMGMVGFFKASASSAPQIIKLLGEKFAVKHLGRYSMVLAGPAKEPDSIIRRQLERLYRVFRFYHGNLDSFLQSLSGQEDCAAVMARVWNTYIPFVRCYGDTIAVSFNAVPMVDLPKPHGKLFLRAYQMLQASQRWPGILGGCLFFKNRVLCTQLSSELTWRLLLIRAQQNHLPCQDVHTDFRMPVGVRLITVHLAYEEYVSLFHLKSGRRRPTAKQASPRNKRDPQTSTSSYGHSSEEEDIPKQGFDNASSQQQKTNPEKNGLISSLKLLSTAGVQLIAASEESNRTQLELIGDKNSYTDNEVFLSNTPLTHLRSSEAQDKVEVGLGHGIDGYAENSSGKTVSEAGDFSHEVVKKGPASSHKNTSVEKEVKDIAAVKDSHNNASLTANNASLTSNNASLTANNASLTANNTSLTANNASLTSNNASLTANNDGYVKMHPTTVEDRDCSSPVDSSPLHLVITADVHYNPDPQAAEEAEENTKHTQNRSKQHAKHDSHDTQHCSEIQKHTSASSQSDQQNESHQMGLGKENPNTQDVEFQDDREGAENVMIKKVGELGEVEQDEPSIDLKEVGASSNSVKGVSSETDNQCSKKLQSESAISSSDSTTAGESCPKGQGVTNVNDVMLQNVSGVNSDSAQLEQTTENPCLERVQSESVISCSDSSPKGHGDTNMEAVILQNVSGVNSDLGHLEQTGENPCLERLESESVISCPAVKCSADTSVDIVIQNVVGGSSDMAPLEPTTARIMEKYPRDKVGFADAHLGQESSQKSCDESSCNLGKEAVKSDKDSMQHQQTSSPSVGRRKGCIDTSKECQTIEILESDKAVNTRQSLVPKHSALSESDEEITVASFGGKNEGWTLVPDSNEGNRNVSLEKSQSVDIDSFSLLAGDLPQRKSTDSFELFQDALEEIDSTKGGCPPVSGSKGTSDLPSRKIPGIQKPKSSSDIISKAGDLISNAVTSSSNFYWNGYMSGSSLQGFKELKGGQRHHYGAMTDGCLGSKEKRKVHSTRNIQSNWKPQVVDFGDKKAQKPKDTPRKPAPFLLRKRRGKSSSRKDEKTIKVTLYIQGHSEMVLLLLMEDSMKTDGDAVQGLWKGALPQLGELEGEIRECLDSARITTHKSEGYHFLMYDNVEKSLKGNMLSPVSAGENGFCSTSTYIHEEVRKSPTITDMTLRKHSGTVFGHRSIDQEIYFQQCGPPKPISGAPSFQDLTFSLESKVRETLAKEHHILLF